MIANTITQLYEEGYAEFEYDEITDKIVVVYREVDKEKGKITKEPYNILKVIGNNVSNRDRLLLNQWLVDVLNDAIDKPEKYRFD